MTTPAEQTTSWWRSRAFLWLSAGVITVVAWLVIGMGHDWNYLGPFVALAALACLAGWRGDRVAALVIYLGGIVGASIVAWAPGADWYSYAEDPAHRQGYFEMYVFLAGAVAAVFGLVAVAGGYVVGRAIRRRKPETSDPL